MKYGIVGLGLIGGSLAKAYHQAGMEVYGCDLDESMQSFAQVSGAIDGVLDDGAIGRCDCILVAIPPKSTCQWLEHHAAQFSRDCMVMDCCGTKERVCRTGFALARQYGFTFVGGHPMAGTHLDRIKSLLTPAGFATVSVTTAEDHDRLIAFTSQLAHVVSNAYVKSPTALRHKGFSAGSYQDLTRVAWLNPTMWSELFIENRLPLLEEIDHIIRSLQEYRDAIAAQDQPRLTQLLDEGRRLKKEVDGK